MSDFGQRDVPSANEIQLFAPFYDEDKDRLSNGAFSLKLGAGLYDEGMKSHSIDKFQKAALCYEKSLSYGNDQAAVNLGYVYEYGRTGNADGEKACSYYYQGMKLGNPEGAMKYGDCLSSGKAVPKDLEKAFKLYDMGYDMAQSLDDNAWVASLAFRLAKCFEQGEGTDPDPIAAYPFYCQASQRYERAIEDGMGYYRKSLTQAKAGQERLGGTADLPIFQPLPAGASFNWDGDMLDSFGMPLSAGVYEDVEGTIFIVRKKFAAERLRLAHRRRVMELPHSLFVSLTGEDDGQGNGLRDFILDFYRNDPSAPASITGAEIRSWLVVDGEEGHVERLIDTLEARLLWGKVRECGIGFWNDEYVSFKPAETTFEWRVHMNGEYGEFESSGSVVGPDRLESLVSALDSALRKE